MQIKSKEFLRLLRIAIPLDIAPIIDAKEMQ